MAAIVKANRAGTLRFLVCLRGKSHGNGAVAAVAAANMPPQAALSNPRWLGRCAPVLDDLGQARDIRLAGNAEA